MQLMEQNNLIGIALFFSIPITLFSYSENLAIFSEYNPKILPYIWNNKLFSLPCLPTPNKHTILSESHTFFSIPITLSSKHPHRHHHTRQPCFIPCLIFLVIFLYNLFQKCTFVSYFEMSCLQQLLQKVRILLSKPSTPKPRTPPNRTTSDRYYGTASNAIIREYAGAYGLERRRREVLFLRRRCS